MTDLCIIGGGIFGSIAARLLSRSMNVTLIDEPSLPNSASRCAAGLLKPSWLDALSSSDRNVALSTLEELYGLREVTFPDAPKVQLFHVDPKRIMEELPGVTRITGRVVNIWPRTHAVELADKRKIAYRYCLVAAGAYSFELLAMSGISTGTSAPMIAKSGIAFWYDEVLPNAFKIWAPFKQAIQFNIREGVSWRGDGSTINAEKWDDGRVYRSESRLNNILGFPPSLPRITTGNRPYVKGLPGGYFAYLDYDVWVATGGAKIGVPAAALFARVLEADLT